LGLLYQKNDIFTKFISTKSQILIVTWDKHEVENKRVNQDHPGHQEDSDSIQTMAPGGWDVLSVFKVLV